ncbi:MAG: hypothetical protein M3131_04915, partial [Actinomycetota bacterium]|nr:hypothetical protein [Actinomycetota bacterium]
MERPTDAFRPPGHGAGDAPERVAVVGAGRLGTALATALRTAGVEVRGPLGRGMAGTADAILLCVPDSEIPG